jgi:hypothetical protein
VFGIKFTPDPECVTHNALQQETWAHRDIAKEAQVAACKLSGHLNNNSSEDRAFRAVWRGREAEYLWERFGNAFGWTSMQQAKDFYHQNKRSLKYG